MAGPPARSLTYPHLREQKMVTLPQFNRYSPWKMMGMEDKPSLLGSGNFSGGYV